LINCRTLPVIADQITRGFGTGGEQQIQKSKERAVDYFEVILLRLPEADV
jgi:hypothetical protein